MGQTDILTLKGKFTACQKMLTVFGDEGPPAPPAPYAGKQSQRRAGSGHFGQNEADAARGFPPHADSEGCRGRSLPQGRKVHVLFSGFQRKGHRQAAGIVRADERDACAPLSRFPTVKKEQE